MAFIGIRAMKVESENNHTDTNVFGRKAKIININPSFVKWVNEGTMLLCLDDNTCYRIDEESLLVFLNAVYGEDRVNKSGK